MYERAHRDHDDSDVPDGFGDRAVWLDSTLGGAGRLTGDLTAGCAAALTAVLDALGKRAGPEDIRSAAQRRHDALEEACRRLVASGMLPGRAGQPTQIQVHMTLAQLRDLPGGSPTETAWATARASQSGWLTGPEAQAAACDASVVPIVTGHVDWAALDRLGEVFLAARSWWPGAPGAAGHANGGAGEADGTTGEASDGTGEGGAAWEAAGHAHGEAGNADAPTGAPRQVAGPGEAARTAAPTSDPASSATRQPSNPAGPLSPDTRQRLRRALLAVAADALSGPGGLAAQLRAGLDGPLASVSLPLDAGPATETIPAHLRRAVTTRHPHCAFPGCAQPASVCEIHHIIPRSRGGPTTLHNLLTLCTFHHKIVIHRWSWTIRLHPDGTTTATSPYGRVLHSHSPPGQAA